MDKAKQRNEFAQMPNTRYRVYIAIYDVDEGSRSEPMTFTDEPLFNTPEEIAAQAYRTQVHFLKDLAKDQ